MKEIKLTKGRVALVDDEDYEDLNAVKWCFAQAHSCEYASRSKDGRTIYMHRQIMAMKLGDGKEIDHIDGNGLNNCRDNLRICSHHQNQMNIRSANGSSSQYRGVFRARDWNGWIAQIKFNGKSRHIGSFKTEIEAALAYDREATKVFESFARLNFLKRRRK